MCESDIVIALLRSAITDGKIDKEIKLNIKKENLGCLYRLAKRHDLAHLVGLSLDKNGLLSGESDAKNVFMKEISLAVFRHEKNTYEENRVAEFLEEQGIEHLLLKGSHFRSLYPEPWMRTSADVDILVKQEKLDLVIKLLCEKFAYKYEEKHSHDVSLYSPSNVHLELHYNLNSEKKLPEADELLENLWDYTCVVEGCKYRRKFIPEMFYFYHIAHAAKHFINGGCGIKFFIDTWLYKNSNEYDSEKVANLLKKGDLDLFDEKVGRLVDVWFNGANRDDLTDRIESFIIGGGVYGSSENRVKIAQARTKNKSKFKYIWGKIFLKYDAMKYMYPVLEKHRWLLPFCQIHRWFAKLFKGRAKNAVNDIKINNSITTEQSMETSMFLKDVGLK